MTTRTATRNKGRQRRALDKAVPQKRLPAIITNIAVQAPETIRLTFNTNVAGNKLPLFTAGDAFGNTVVSMAQVSATEIDLTFDGDVEDTTMRVTENDPGIRTAAGGFVPAGTYSLAITP